MPLLRPRDQDADRIAIRSADRAPVSVRALVTRFALAGLVALILVVGGTVVASRRIGTRIGVAEAERVAALSGRGIVEPALTPGVVAGDPAALAELDRIVRRDVLQNSLVRVRIWRPDGTILYADDDRLIGRRFELGQDELELLDNGNVDADVSDLSSPENALESRAQPLLEAYLAIWGPDDTPLLFEAYFRLDSVHRAGRATLTAFLPVVVGALVLLQAVQVPLAWSMAKRLRREQRRREQLLRTALATSDNERRRIAGELHDGVVQDLTGLSFALAAAARRPGDVPAGLTGDAAAQLRRTVQALRTMLVELYPADLAQEGIEGALADLAARIEAQGTEVRLEIDPATADLPPDQCALVYRVAQEALRNVASHARATQVSVALTTESGQVVLVVDDDGGGFDVDMLGERVGDGHVGLRVMADVAEASGASLTLASAPGEGTAVRLVLPRTRPVRAVAGASS